MGVERGPRALGSGERREKQNWKTNPLHMWALGVEICKQACLLRSPWWDGGTLQPRGAPGAVAMPCPDVPPQGSGSKDESRGIQRLHARSWGAPSESPQQLELQCSAAHWHQQCFLSEVVGKGLDYPEERAVWAPNRTALLHHIPHLPHALQNLQQASSGTKFIGVSPQTKRADFYCHDWCI